MKLPSYLSNTKGTAAVEFALVAWIFFYLVFAIMDFGRYFFIQHTLQAATREGTRLALVGVQLKDEDDALMTRVASIVKTIKDQADTAVDPASLLISIYPVGEGYSDPEEWETILDAGAGGDYMRVRTRYTYHFMTPFISKLFSEGKNVIWAQALYRNELF